MVNGSARRYNARGMARRKRTSVQRYHDRVAPRYDHSYEDAYWRWHDRLTWDYLKPHLPADLSAPVADLGTGTGKWAARLAKSGFAVTCVDISLPMLEQARRKLEAYEARGRTAFVQADLCDLSQLETGRFALAVALGDPIGCSQSPPRALKEIRRILRPGARLVATFDNKLSAIEFYLEKGDPGELGRFLRHGVTHWLTRDAAEQFPIHTFTPREITRLLASAGFEVIEVLGKTVLPMRHYRPCLHEADARRAWAAIEKKLCRDQDALVLASHLQVACRAV